MKVSFCIVAFVLVSIAENRVIVKRQGDGHFDDGSENDLDFNHPGKLIWFNG